MSRFKGTINVDLDGVVYDFGRAIRDWITLQSGTRIETIPSWGVKDGEFNRWWRMGVEAGFVWGTDAFDDYILPGAREYMWKLSDDEWKIRIVTTRLVQSFNHRVIQDNTTNWLDKNNIPYREIGYLAWETPKSDYRADFAIDDRPSHIDEYVEAGTAAYLLTQWWNANADTLGERVEDWKAFYEAVTGNSGGEDRARPMGPNEPLLPLGPSNTSDRTDGNYSVVRNGPNSVSTVLFGEDR